MGPRRAERRQAFLAGRAAGRSRRGSGGSLGTAPKLIQVRHREAKPPAIFRRGVSTPQATTMLSGIKVTMNAEAELPVVLVVNIERTIDAHRCQDPTRAGRAVQLLI